MNRVTGTAFLVATVVLSVTACAESPVSPSGPALSASVVRDGVRLTVSLDSGTLRSAEPNWAAVAIENLGQRPVRYVHGCGASASLFVDLDAALDPGVAWPGRLGRFKALAIGPEFGAGTSSGFIPESMITPPGAIPFGCPAMLSVDTMQPGEVLVSRALWDGLMVERPAPTGGATVTAWFPFIGLEGIVGRDVTDATPIKATLIVEIAGSGEGAATSAALAIDAALADPDFAAFVNAKPEGTWINPHLNFVDGVWEVGLFRFGSDDPDIRDSFGAVRVDSDGSVISHRFEPPLR